MTDYARNLAAAAREASGMMVRVSGQNRIDALRRAADALRRHRRAILGEHRDARMRRPREQRVVHRDVEGALRPGEELRDPPGDGGGPLASVRQEVELDAQSTSSSTRCVIAKAEFAAGTPQ